MAALRGKSIDAAEVFGRAIEKLAPTLTGGGPEWEKMAAANRYFLERIPARDTEAELAASLVDLIPDYAGSAERRRTGIPREGE
jgi:hypothetical protein